MDYYKTVLTVEILGTEPYAGDVTDLAHDIVYGEFSGAEVARSVEQVTEAEMAELLLAQGSDPSFLIPEED